jgi:DNA-binding NarL/FixJ family response regulator
MTIHVLIADDHSVVAEGLRHLLDAYPDIDVVATVNSGRDAVHEAIKLHPQVVLMDSNMPDMNGIEATRILHEREPHAKVLMLSVHSDPFHIVRALRAGASGYVPKSSVGSDVVDAIREVNKGKRYLHASVAEGVLERLVDAEMAADPVACLSSRETQVLQMMAEGKSVSQIAQTISLSVRTVETYRARMMEKLGIRDTPTLVKFAIVHGLTSLP